ncbi:hypothetical protein OG21DRAFT_1508454 [Imleria badia]|nr:hypothetical protein OG21DRAFT_1508454 [Imleria badia]
MSEVDFFILLNKNPVLVSAKPGNTLVQLFSRLRDNVDAVEYLPTKVYWHACDFYRLNNPVALGEDPIDHEGSRNFMDIPDEVKEACFQESNRMAVNPMATKVHSLGDEFFEDHIYLVIETPDPHEESNKAIWKLQQHHNALFECLQVMVEKPGAWCPEDVMRNMRGGILSNDINALPPAFREIHDALAQQRVYNVCTFVL